MPACKTVSASFSTPLGVGSSIVFLPEGTHDVFAEIGGRPKKATITVGPDCLDCFVSSLEARKAENVRPFAGFDHQVGAASFIPTAFRYEDGVGLVLDVEWTHAGLAAIEGRDYSYFSPTFLLGKDGTPLGLAPSGEVGSLVNDPAFRAIPRIAASNANLNNIMENHELLVTLGLVEENTPVEDGIEVAKAALATLREGVVKASDAETLAAEMEALKAEKEATEAKLAEAQAKLDEIAAAEAAAKEAEEKAAAEAADAAADATVEEAVQAGRIAPKDDTAKAFWKASVLADPNAKLVLASLPSILENTPIAKAASAKKELCSEVTKEEFDSFSPAQKSEFAKSGGKIIS